MGQRVLWVLLLGGNNEELCSVINILLVLSGMSTGK